MIHAFPRKVARRLARMCDGLYYIGMVTIRTVLFGCLISLPLVAVMACGGTPFSVGGLSGDGATADHQDGGLGTPEASKPEAEASVPQPDGSSDGANAGDGGALDAPAETAEGAADVGAQDGSDGGDCTVGAARCVGNSAETCQSTGHWSAPAACGGQTCQGGACVGVCAPGDVICDGQQPESCGPAGTWQASGAACSEANAVCASGSCQACTCAGTTSCFYDVSEPASGYGAPYPVTVVFLTPTEPTATFTATITSPPAYDHNAVWYDLDVTAFPQGGTVTISGTMGSSGTDGSSFLVTQCAAFPATGQSIPVVENVGNIAAGSAWSFGDYSFAAGTGVLHFGTEGSWGPSAACPSACAAGSTNTNAVTVSVH